MTMDEAHRFVGMNVRPQWATSQAHWRLIRVMPDGRALLRTNRGKERWEPVSAITLTGGSVKRVEGRRMKRYMVEMTYKRRHYVDVPATWTQEDVERAVEIGSHRFQLPDGERHLDNTTVEPHEGEGKPDLVGEDRDGSKRLRVP